jgi:hypothetical protein
MKKGEWGPLIWKVLHCITIKIKDEEFPQERENIIKMITNICSNLPCPQCASHSTGIIKKHRLNNVKTKDDLIKFVYFMHNTVNKRLKKPNYSFKNIEQYNQYNTKDVLSEYFNKNLNARYGEKMMLHSYHRKNFLKQFCDYFRKNISKFNQ